MARLEQPIDLAAVEASVAARRGERLHQAVIGPSPERIRIDAEKARGRAERETQGLGWCGDSRHDRTDPRWESG
jgi:hypothetical protein